MIATADEEVDPPTRKLLFGGLAAGFAITPTFLVYATVSAAVPGDPTGLLAPSRTRSGSSTSWWVATSCTPRTR